MNNNISLIMSQQFRTNSSNMLLHIKDIMSLRDVITIKMCCCRYKGKNKYQWRYHV